MNPPIYSTEDEAKQTSDNSLLPAKGYYKNISISIKPVHGRPIWSHKGHKAEDTIGNC